MIEQDAVPYVRDIIGFFLRRYNRWPSLSTLNRILFEINPTLQFDWDGPYPSLPGLKEYLSLACLAFEADNWDERQGMDVEVEAAIKKAMPLYAARLLKEETMCQTDARTKCQIVDFAPNDCDGVLALYVEGKLQLYGEHYNQEIETLIHGFTKGMECAGKVLRWLKPIAVPCDNELADKVNSGMIQPPEFIEQVKKCLVL